MPDLKVLIITYYWPPAGGSGVQRWLKFVKYLREFGIDPVVFCPENPSYPIEDKELLSDVPEHIEILKLPITEFNKPNIKQAGFLKSRPGIKDKFMQFVRANFMIPDARFLWIRPAAKFLKNYLRHSNIDFIISTGPPHSMHLIARQLKRETGIPWLADFRDPWTEIDYFHHLPFTVWAKNKHKRLEQRVLESADIVTVVSTQMQKKYQKRNANCELLYNGFDGNIAPDTSRLDEKFSLVHVGSINADRCPKQLFKVLGELVEELPDFREDLELKLVGKVAPEVIDHAIEKGLEHQLKLVGYVSHHEVHLHQEQAWMLLLLLNNVPASRGIITGKVFEYFRSRRPVLAIGPKGGDLDVLLQQTKAGALFDFEEYEGLKKQIIDAHKAYKKGSLKVDSKKISNFHRRVLTGQLAKILRSYDKS